jgi:hypothetical protein
MAQIDDQEFAGQNLAVQELVLQVPIVAWICKQPKNATSPKHIIWSRNKAHLKPKETIKSFKGWNRQYNNFYCKFQQGHKFVCTPKLQIIQKKSYEATTKPIQSPKRRSRACKGEMGSTGTCTASSSSGISCCSPKQQFHTY